MSDWHLDERGMLKVKRSRSPRAAIATPATPPHLLPRCQDAERTMRPAPRWQRVAHPAAGPQWREPYTEVLTHAAR